MADKQCSKCGKVFPRTREHFDAKTNSPDGLRADCKACRRIQMRAYRQRPEVKAKDHAYYEANRDEIIAKSREWTLAHPEKRRAIEQRARNKPGRKAYMQQYGKAYNQRPYVQGKARTRSRLRRLSPIVQQYEQEYRASLTGRAHQKIRKLRKRARNLAIDMQLTAHDILIQYESQKGLCWWCGNPLDSATYQIDHRIALAKGGGNNPGNIVCSCPGCNQKKGVKTPWDWQGRLL